MAENFSLVMLNESANLALSLVAFIVCSKQ